MSAAEDDGIPEELRAVFQRFGELEERVTRKLVETDAAPAAAEKSSDKSLKAADEALERPIKKDELKTLSKKKLKRMMRPSIAELKMQAPRPDVVESWDVAAPDPNLLVWLKAYRNTVPVPIHWNMKSRYLSGKRAIEKVPYRLPPYMEATKIGEIRAALLEKESRRTMAQKQREKVRPKAHRMHIDFQVLHDAFFKYATKPELTEFGDLYYEGKEFQERSRHFKPGQLSDALKEALGMVLPTQPPPWLFMMQRYGPPPSYPNLKIPGVNAPIPAGCQWGINGWGKAPTDHFGNPLYPNIYTETPAPPKMTDEPVVYWGEPVESMSEESEAEDEGQ